MAKKYKDFKCNDCLNRTEVCRGVKIEGCLLYTKEKTLLEQLEERIKVK